MVLMDGKALKNKILVELQEKIKNENINATLAIILVGENEASKIYIKNKVRACEEIGIVSKVYNLSENTSETELCNLINELNFDEEITGIILQSPVPSHIDFDKCSSLIKNSKDVDGFTMANTYDLYLNSESLVPCTVKAIIKLLEEYQINLEGANVVVIGRGNIVGKPLMLALLNRNATVTIAHSKTRSLEEITKKADILIAAVGKPKLITSDMIKDGAVVIDVGISRIDGKIVGDVDFENVSKKCGFITPVPGGVGPMTVAMIMENVLIAKEMSDNNG